VQNIKYSASFIAIMALTFIGLAMSDIIGKWAMWIFIPLGLALGCTLVIAQFRLFAIADTLKEILKEIQLFRLERMRDAGQITAEDYSAQCQMIQIEKENS